ncbi:JAB domain-containing protein [Sphingomonas tabacisoli]|uniref:JAB domain-containing protein n=1 Tax=Sphingomonas tabacisoli TaxID=2249466 RepID=A0ABW4HZ64_9SPHN
MQRVRGRLPQIIASRDDAVALFAPRLADAQDENLYVAHLDRERRLLALCLAPGRGRQIDVPLRTIIRDALEFDTASLVLAHNHPSGDPTPSSDDLYVTRRLIHVARALEVGVLDHLVFAAKGFVSFRDRGLL